MPDVAEGIAAANAAALPHQVGLNNASLVTIPLSLNQVIR